MMPKNRLDEKSLYVGVSILTEADSDLENVITKFGNPPLWSREPGYSTLVHIILEQQVSLASAKAAFNKLKEAVENDLTPERFLEFSDTELKNIGFSRQKTKYCRELSKSLINGDLELDKLEGLDNADARKELKKIKGIGDWTANIYLLMALMRPDVWPSGDLALKKSIQKIKSLPDTPSSERCDEIASQWKPLRAVAARIIWHHYLNQPSL
ncbi:DNA-3-methyladenine glycosylase family protein [Rhodohalobacter sp. 8-1]|uniref:DNA-3-methyladenine glycosylase family protein n=1 Tax=Rhodohalobacter sp. 8-1 TaxID=3131972 RepID=UPI0030ECED90